MDERLERLGDMPAPLAIEGNAFSDALLGVPWGMIGAGGVLLVIGSVSGAREVITHGSTGVLSVLGLAVAGPLVFIVPVVLVGAPSGFVAAAVARFGDSMPARGLGGVLGSVLGLIGWAALVHGGDLSYLFVPAIGELFLTGAALAAGAGLLAGCNVGRELGD